LRPSGTEPLIRVMIEGQDSEMVRVLTQQLAGVVEQLACVVPGRSAVSGVQ
jgi:phosphoglucosamine mutase